MEKLMKRTYITSLTPEQRRERSSKGGAKILEKYGREHFAKLGRKGGRKTSMDRDHMAEIGSRGGSNQTRKSRFDV